MDDKILKALCGDRAVKDAPGALGMKNPEIIDFIKGKAPPEVMDIFDRLQKKTRPELCKILRMFPKGQEILKASQPNILENMKKVAPVVDLPRLNAGMGNLVFGNDTNNFVANSRRQIADPFSASAKLDARLQAKMMRSGVKGGKNKRLTRLSIFTTKPGNVKRASVRYNYPKPPAKLNIKGTRPIKLGDSIVLPSKPLPKKTRMNIAKRAEIITAGMEIPNNKNYENVLNEVKFNLFREAEKARNLGLINSSNNDEPPRPSFSLLPAREPRVVKGSVRNRLLTKMREMNRSQRRPKPVMNKKPNTFMNFNNIGINSNNEEFANDGEEFIMSNSNNEPAPVAPKAVAKAKKAKRLILKPAIRQGMEKLYNNTPGPSNRKSAKNLTNQELKNAVNEMIKNMN